jgi:hypothetical protein
MEIGLRGKYSVGKTAIVSEKDFPLVNKHNWHVNKDGYAECNIQGAKWNGITGIYFPYVFSEEECSAIDAQMRDQIDWEEIIDVLNNWNNRD